MKQQARFKNHNEVVKTCLKVLNVFRNFPRDLWILEKRVLSKKIEDKYFMINEFISIDEMFFASKERNFSFMFYMNRPYCEKEIDRAIFIIRNNLIVYA